MATARKTLKQRVVETELVSLELTNEEAQVLAEILTSIAGSMEGRRGKSDAIARALSRVGFSYTSNTRENIISGSITLY